MDNVIEVNFRNLTSKAIDSIRSNCAEIALATGEDMELVERKLKVFRQLVHQMMCNQELPVSWKLPEDLTAEHREQVREAVATAVLSAFRLWQDVSFNTLVRAMPDLMTANLSLREPFSR